MWTPSKFTGFRTLYFFFRSYKLIPLNWHVEIKRSDTTYCGLGGVSRPSENPCYLLSSQNAHETNVLWLFVSFLLRFCLLNVVKFLHTSRVPSCLHLRELNSKEPQFWLVSWRSSFLVRSNCFGEHKSWHGFSLVRRVKSLSDAILYYSNFSLRR